MSVTSIDQMGGVIHTQAVVSFYNGSIINASATAKAARPIYDDVEMIKIAWSGNTRSEFHAPASDRSDRPLINPEDKSRWFPRWKDHPDFVKTYEAFKSGQAHAVNGTPITELPFLTEARRLELKAVNIFTAEQLVGLDPHAKLGRELADVRAQAKLYLDRAAGAAVDAIHAAEKAAMQSQLDELKAQFAELASMGAKPKTAKVAAPAVPAAPVSTSPFNDWEPDDIRAWMKDADPSAPEPHHKLGKAKLVEAAEELNTRLQAAKAA